MKPRFLPGSHQEELVGRLTQKFINKETRMSDIPALVVLKQKAQLWAALGNRRLKAMQDYQTALGEPVAAKCIEWNMGSKEYTVPPALVGKLIASATTKNGGTHMEFTRRA